MRWYAGAIVILAAALALGLGLLAYAMYVLLAMLLVSRLLARSWAGSLVGHAGVQPRVGQCGRHGGRGAQRAEHAARLPVAWVLLEDLLPRDALGRSRRSSRSSAAGCNWRCSASAAGRPSTINCGCNQRGYYQIGPLVLETGDLFGLHRRCRLLAAPHFVLVYPKTVALEGYDIASRRPIGEVRMAHRLYEDPTRIAGMRPYQTGDPMNRIHWRATARTGVLHSKVYEPSSVAGATLLLDFHRDSYDRGARAVSLGAGDHRGGVAGQRPLSHAAAGRAGDQRPRRRGPHPPARAGSPTSAPAARPGTRPACWRPASGCNR